MVKRHFLLKVWDGPFSLGPLTKPVAAVDAVMKVLEVAWKLGVIAAGLFLIASVVALASNLHIAKDSNWSASKDYGGVNASNQNLADLDPAAHMSYHAEYGGKECPSILEPIAIFVTNNGSRDVVSYSWRLWINLKGHSSDLNYGDPEGNYSDWILKPGESHTICQAMPSLVVEGSSTPGYHTPAPQDLESKVYKFEARTAP